MAWAQNLPVDLVFVRHGESEGNLCDRLPESSGAREKLGERHTCDFRLTDLGRNQAARAGKIVQEHVGTFHKMYCSEFVRAVETSAHMNLPESMFQTDELIREIDVGRGRSSSCQRHGAGMKELASGAWWSYKSPTGGETFADMALRLRSFLQHLCDTAAGLKVLVVCHAHTIRAFSALLEDAKGTDYDRLLNWEIPNCHIRWYTRQEDYGNVHVRPFKVIELNMEEPTNLSRSDSGCTRTEKKIVRPLLNVAELRKRAEALPQLLNNSHEVEPPAKQAKKS